MDQLPPELGPLSQALLNLSSDQPADYDPNCLGLIIVATSDGDDEPMTGFACIGMDGQICRGVVRIGIHSIGAGMTGRRPQSRVGDFTIGKLGHGVLSRHDGLVIGWLPAPFEMITHCSLFETMARIQTLGGEPFKVGTGASGCGAHVTFLAARAY